MPPVAVEQPGNPLQNCRRLSRTRRALDKEEVVLGIPDNFILRPLDGRDDALHLGTGVVAEGFQQHLVTNLFVGVKDGDDRAVLDLELPFKGQVDLLGTHRRFVADLAELALVVNGRNRGPPVINQEVVRLVAKRGQADVD